MQDVHAVPDHPEPYRTLDANHPSRPVFCFSAFRLLAGRVSASEELYSSPLLFCIACHACRLPVTSLKRSAPPHLDAILFKISNYRSREFELRGSESRRRSTNPDVSTNEERGTPGPGRKNSRIHSSNSNFIVIYVTINSDHLHLVFSFDVRLTLAYDRKGQMNATIQSCVGRWGGNKAHTVSSAEVTVPPPPDVCSPISCQYTAVKRLEKITTAATELRSFAVFLSTRNSNSLAVAFSASRTRTLYSVLFISANGGHSYKPRYLRAWMDGLDSKPKFPDIPWLQLRRSWDPG